MTTLWALFLAYLLGSIPTGYLIGKAVKGLDIRKHGSGNVGASNVFRVVGRSWGLGVLAVDILKGVLAVRLLYSLFFEGPSSFSASALIIQLALGFAAIAGHNWTIFLGFKGGKGVATTCGVFLAIVPAAAISALIVWFCVVLVTKYISVGSILGALSCPLWIGLFYRNDPEFKTLFIVACIVPGLIIYTHRTNITRLRAGTEAKITDR